MSGFKDFLKSGIQEIKEVGKGLTPANFAVMALTTMIATNAISAPFMQQVDVQPLLSSSSITQSFDNQASVSHLPKLTATNYEQVFKDGQNTVFENPFNEGQVLTVLFQKPTTEFFKDAFGPDFLKTQSFTEFTDFHQDYDKHFSDNAHLGATGYHQPVHIDGEKDPNLTKIASYEDIVADTQARFNPSPEYADLYAKMLFWHEMKHSSSEQAIEWNDGRILDSQVLAAEMSSDVFAVLHVAKGELLSGNFKSSADVIKLFENRIAHRTFDQVYENQNGYEILDVKHLTQPALMVAKVMFESGKIDLQSSDIHALSDLSTQIAEETMSQDLTELAHTTLMDDESSAFEMTQEGFEREVMRLQRIVAKRSLEKAQNYSLKKGNRLGDSIEGFVQLWSDMNSNPDAILNLKGDQITEYAKKLAEMPGGAQYTGSYDLTHPFVNAQVYKMGDNLYEAIANKALSSGSLDTVNLAAKVSQTDAGLTQSRMISSGHHEPVLFSPQLNAEFVLNKTNEQGPLKKHQHNADYSI